MAIIETALTGSLNATFSFFVFCWRGVFVLFFHRSEEGNS